MNASSVIAVNSTEHLNIIRALFAEYGQIIEKVAGCSLRHQGFDAELATLPGKYAPPRGRLYLATLNGNAVGCAALRPLPGTEPTDAIGEVKRMYVQPHARGHKLGDLLIRQLISDAQQIGYRTLKLDTSTTMHAAQKVYARAGFVLCGRYNDDPMDDTLWFERAIDQRDRQPAAQ